MSKHPSTRYEGKMRDKKKMEELAKKNSDLVYFEDGHYKRYAYSTKKKKNYRNETWED